MILRRMVLLATVLLAQKAMAEGVTVAGSMTTLGPAVQVSAPYNDVVNLRLFLGGYRYTTDEDLSGINYDAKYTLSGLGAIMDWHPFGSGFHISLGLFRTSNRFDGRSIDAAEYAIGANTYSASEVQSLRVKADLGAGAPYSGMGWGYAIGETGWGFEVEAGVVYQASPVAVVYANPGPALSGNLTAEQSARLALLRQDQDLEARNIKDEFDTFKAFPVISAGVTYTFK
ncbi:MAG TPA: hypothetical protein VFM46_01635 [Pseudomonadales bacterium]|nr:hypothetical protein [Pseudomonadales bacterium]